MHIPDGFLSTPVWAALDVAAAPAAAAMTRLAQRGFDEKRVPLLGVMGAFVFAAQMINFPVGAGTSGHLVGGALLAMSLGPAAASVVMTAILAIQALVFQDGGILALGANVFNMAIGGVLAGYLPYHLWGAGRGRRVAVFLGGFLSVLVAAVLALAELQLSGIAMPAALLGVSLGLFVVSAVLEGAITLAVFQAMETLHPDFVRQPAGNRSRTLGGLGLAAVLLAVVGVWFASASPDGLERLAENLGIAGRAKAFLPTPLAGYQAGFIQAAWLRKAAAGLTGLALIYAACALFGRWLAPSRQRSA
ncbi:MAG: energy-coupling factor ABC transporter permease [Acidobacteria bacterium]|nr:energy-coupling factor ABC transporter permease [Acidobacteriota bacterium]MBI3471725.1 energy-coupling factor ABC transporter permease [Candidatus Solibacter usitatus]